MGVADQGAARGRLRRLAAVAGVSIAISGCAGASKTEDALGLDENAEAKSAMTPPRAALAGRAADGTEFRLQGGRLEVDLRRAPDRLREDVRGARTRVVCGDLVAQRPWPAAAGETLTFELRISPANAELDRFGRQIERCSLYEVPGAEPVTSAPMRPS